MQRIGILVFAGLLLCSGATAMGQKVTTSQGQQLSFENAEDLFRKEKYASAQFQFDQIEKTSAGTLTADDACYYAAVCSEKLGNDDAINRLQRFMTAYPQSSHLNMARFYMGNCYYRNKDYSNAFLYYGKVKKADVDYGCRSEYDFKMGYCCLNMNNNEQAKRHFEQLMDGKSKYSNAARYYYAHIQYQEGEYDLSLKNFELLKNDHNFAKIVPNYIIRLYYYLGREDEMLQMAPALIQSEDVYKEPEVHQMVAEVYYKRGNYANALQHYHAAASVDGNSAIASKGMCSKQDCFYQMGFCHYKLGAYDSAAVYLGKKTVCNDSVAQNALYLLGDCYIKMNQKEDALAAFRQAANMDYNRKIKDDAQFQVAKLSCELNKNTYNESIRQLQKYLEQHKNTEHKAEIQEMLASLYLTTRNYKDAYDLIESIPDKNAALNQAYQRIAINRGIEIFNTGKVKAAAPYFQKAMTINATPKVTADAYYLYAESQYRMGKYVDASKAMDRFLLGSYAKTSPYYLQALYTEGYIRMQLEDYDDAYDAFSKFSQQAKNVEPRQMQDVYNRMGDCKYVNKAFDDAIVNYNYVINANGKDADYATYQKALCYGALGKYPEKLNNLNYIFEKFNNSQYASKATFEIGKTYLLCDNTDMSLLYYRNFINQYPDNSQVKSALLDMGLIYYNTGRNAEALQTFDRLLTDYAGTDEARDALNTVKNIYISENRVDEYFGYVKSVAKISVPTLEQDSTIYLAAEDRYMEGRYEEAVTALENYLKKFPNGLFSLKAHYYAADAYFRTGQNESALTHYEVVAMGTKNQYTEQSLYNAANIAYNLNNYTKSIDLYSRLVENSENDNSRLQGRLGLLRSYVALSSYREVVNTAEALLADSKISTALKEEALMSEARAYAALNQEDSSLMVYNRLLKASNGEYAAEAAYRQAEYQYLKGDYATAERSIDKIVSNPQSDYWLARTFILWADVYAAKGNNLQAKLTLQSIIDGYDGEDLVRLATEKRDAIIASETPESEPEENPITITIEN